MEVIVANPRKLRAIYQNDRKSDEQDALIIARLARVDPNLLHPIQHGSEEAQRDLLRIKLRDNLVRQRVATISTVRFSLKSLGLRLPSPSTRVFAKRARALLAGEPELLAAATPSLTIIDALTEQVTALDKEIETLCEERYPETARLREIRGVGPLTTLCFVLVVGGPERFAKSRQVGAYLGFVPKRDQSGGLDKQLRISKAGNAHLRRLLVGSAQYILGPFGEDCDLRAQGLKLASRGGRGAKKKAVIATARKLAVVMHTLWQSGESYRPNREHVQEAA